MYDLYCSMVVAVITMNMVQLALKKIIKMISMGNFRAVFQLLFCMVTALLPAVVGIFGRNFNAMLLYLPTYDMLQMIVVEVINMIPVLYPEMPALFAMLMLA